MKIISKEEKNKLPFKSGRAGMPRQMMQHLDVDQTLVLTEKECPGKRGPYPTVYRMNKKTSKHFEMEWYGKKNVDRVYGITRTK